MRKLIVLIIAAQVLAVTAIPARADGVEDLLRIGTTLLGAAGGHALCRDQNDLVHIACIGGGGVLGYVIGDKLTRNDARVYDRHYDECMNSRRCNSRRNLPDARYQIEIQRGERVYLKHRRRDRCRSFTEVLLDRRGHIVDQRTRYACYNQRRNRWIPIDRRDERRVRFFDGQDSRQRSWDYDQDQGYNPDDQGYGNGAPPPVRPPQGPPEVLPYVVQ